MNESNRTHDYMKTFFIVLVPSIYRWSGAVCYGTPCTRKHVAKSGTREGVGSRHKLRQRSTFCDFMQSWCDKRHAPSLFSHEPLSSSHASTLVLPTSPLLFARVRGTRPKNEKRETRQPDVQTTTEKGNKKRNEGEAIVALRNDFLESDETLANPVLRFSRLRIDSPTVRSRGNDLIGRRSKRSSFSPRDLVPRGYLLYLFFVLFPFFVSLAWPFQLGLVNY